VSLLELIAIIDRAMEALSAGIQDAAIDIETATGLKW